MPIIIDFTPGSIQSAKGCPCSLFIDARAMAASNLVNKYSPRWLQSPPNPIHQLGFWVYLKDLMTFPHPIRRIKNN